MAWAVRALWHLPGALAVGTSTLNTWERHCGGGSGLLPQTGSHGGAGESNPCRAR